MILHNAVPLIAGLLNVSLAVIAVLRNGGSRLNRLFIYFVSAMAVWNFGVFMLRRAPDPRSAFLWEIVIHVGIIAVPVLYYHFVVVFLERTTEYRPSVMFGYTLLIFFLVADLSATPLFMKGVVSTYWGWAPATGPLYVPFFVYLYAFFIAGLVRLAPAYRGITSSFRRNRAILVMAGTVMTLGGGLVDFVRFFSAQFFPAADRIYPVGIPANMICAVLLGVAIVRYRMFDVSVAVKKFAVYGVAGVVITGLLALVTRVTETYFELEASSAVWVVVPVGLIITMLVSPLGQPLGDRIHRLMFSKRRGCYDTLLELSRRMGTILDFGRLVETLVHDLVRGIPLTHCALLVYDESSKTYVVCRQDSSLGEVPGAGALRADSPVIKWLEMSDGLLVKEEVKLNPKTAEFFAAAEADLDEITAPLIVGLKVEIKLIGVLLVGEKLSGEIFDGHELQVLSVLANQAAISLENARLYDELAVSNVRLSQASQLKSQFLASMSHELRTPLNSIIGFSKVLLNRSDGELNERQDAYVRSVHNSSRHLLELINDVLDISRIEAGKLEMNPADVELGELVEECLQSAASLIRNKPLRVETDLPATLPTLHVDRTKVRQILLNLLSNAIKFTAAGRVTLRIRTEDDMLHVTVADTGIGIAASDLPRLFKPFERLPNALSRGAGGTGLGLALSKKFVEMHGGRIWVESRERQGSTFHFTLPLAANAPAAVPGS